MRPVSQAGFDPASGSPTIVLRLFRRLDGSQWVAKAGEDYTIPDIRFRHTVAAACRKRAMTSHAKVRKERVVAFQAVPKNKPSEATPAA